MTYAPEPVAPGRRSFLARAWDNGIPLWQKFVVWAGAAGVAWTTSLGLFMFLAPDYDTGSLQRMLSLPVSVLLSGLAASLALSAGFWIWPLARGRWRTLAVFLATPATVASLFFSPAIWIVWGYLATEVGERPDAGIAAWTDLIMPPLIYLGLLVFWLRTIRDVIARQDRVLAEGETTLSSGQAGAPAADGDGQGPTVPRLRFLAVLLWNSGIPLWQRLVVCAWAARKPWTTFAGFWTFRDAESRTQELPPDINLYYWSAVSLALSAGFVIWPLTRGRWRVLALVIAVPATLEFLFLFPLVVLYVMMSAYSFGHAGFDISEFGLNVLLPPLVYPALAIVWFRAYLDFLATDGRATILGNEIGSPVSQDAPKPDGDSIDQVSAMSGRRDSPAPAGSSGIPLWQKLVVWVGAAGVAWTTFLVPRRLWGGPEGRVKNDPGLPVSDTDIFLWFVASLLLPAGLWFWPLARGRWRIVAQVLSVLPTLEFLILAPVFAFFTAVILVSSDPGLLAFPVLGICGSGPLLGFAALVIIWGGALRDFRARRARRLSGGVAP